MCLSLGPLGCGQVLCPPLWGRSGRPWGWGLLTAPAEKTTCRGMMMAFHSLSLKFKIGLALATLWRKTTDSRVVQHR